MSDYFIKAADAAALTAALEAAGVLDTEGMLCEGYALDIIGTIHKPTGEMLLGEGGEYPEMAPIDGYHANLRGELAEDQKAKLPLIDAPAKPVRVWA